VIKINHYSRSDTDATHNQCYGFKLNYMKNALFILIDITFVMTGITLIPIFFKKWKGIGFVLNSKVEMGAPFNGNAYLILILLGMALICYAVFDFILFRKSTANKGGYVLLIKKIGPAPSHDL